MSAPPEHTYVVPAYRESPFLAECLESLASQSKPSRIVVTTSTPFAGLDELAARYGAEVVRHRPNLGIGRDWNRAFEAAATPLVTISHQDDLYHPRHCQTMIDAFARTPDALLGFTECAEIAANEVRRANRTTRVKHLLRELAFLGRRSVSARAAKMMLLRFGNAIPCPAVTLNKHQLPGFQFREDMRTNMDWAAWLSLASMSGAFVTVREPLVFHRIHSSSETTACIADGKRAVEDLEMFQAMWPGSIAGLLAKLYSMSYSTNA